MDPPTALFPLKNIDEIHLQELCLALWRWDRCEVCLRGQPCELTTCPWKRWTRLKPFFQFYKACTAFYVPELLSGKCPALSGHNDLFNIIRLLQDKRTTSREVLIAEYFSTCCREDSQPEESDIHRAFNLALRIMAMVTCSGENQPADLFDAGSEPLEWRDSESLLQFFESTFPTRDYPTLNEKDELEIDRSQLKAVQLQRIAGLKFHGTDNLRDHLRINQDTGVVELYHHTSVLKEYLNMKGPDLSNSALTAKTLRFVEFPKCLSVLDKTIYPESHTCDSIIPRQLALETLDSIQKIIFPMDRESQRMLRSLVSKQNLDPDLLRFDTAINRAEHNLKYQYWGSRLMDLYDEIENPKPRGLLEQWIERKSGARYIMMATLAGVVIAVVLGLLGLAIGIFQAWVGYQQWKHPVADG